MAGKIRISADFDDRLSPELQRYFEGEDDDPGVSLLLDAHVLLDAEPALAASSARKPSPKT
jgi:hypothetical protein